MIALQRVTVTVCSECLSGNYDGPYISGCIMCDEELRLGVPLSRRLGVGVEGPEPEVVICAAIRLADGRIFRGHRHGCCIQTAREVLAWNGGVNPGEHHLHALHRMDQGFMTSRNRYVDRKEGVRLQLAAGIESVADGGYRGQLYSEDLY